ncbi:hypothetical protein GE107_04650 [Cohnella sp. CFH 77786]|uniref:hypothetical protein n=1 Tax=Cohnella sp. CFH 77786 TaxID=2662265 RepID=UPI001C60EE13|nr:hypothetical protein [Cohnella sp. CFH 77786]MBW5445350.1 hypothetical protein [Cohnella sp. CFH 77786]
MKKAAKHEGKKMALGAVAAIGLCTLLFSGSTQAAKLAIFHHSETVPTTYNLDSITGSSHPDVPDGYVKSKYTVKLVETPDKPPAQDMSMEKAAELGAQNLWRLYSATFDNQTIYMTYIPADDYQSRALWYGEVNINDTLFYSFQLDAVTGESYSASRWDDSSETVEPLEYLKDYQDFISLAKSTAEKYRLVSGKVISGEYVLQEARGKHLVIVIRVASDNGQEAELTFETHNKDLVYVAYDSEVKQEKKNVEKSNQEAAQND